MTGPAPRPPRLPGLPLLGSGPAFFRDAMGVLRRGAELGPVFELRLGPRSAAVVTGAAPSRDVLAQPLAVLSLRPVYRWVIPMFGPVLQAAEPPQYAAQREAVLPAFRAAHAGAHDELMRLEAERWLASFGPAGQFDAVEDLARLSFDIAVHAFLGPDYRQRAGEQFRRDYHDVAAGMEFFLPPNLPLPRLRRRDRARAALLAELGPRVELARRDPDPAVHGFLAQLAAARTADGEPLPADIVVGLIMTLVFAAYETTAAQLAWTLGLLLQHPAELAALRDTLGTPEGARRRHWCRLEAERLQPVTTMIWRHVEQPYEVAGYAVPAGWLTILCPPVTHRDPVLFPGPDRFEPERFDPARDPHGQAAGALLTFGGGPHRCLGIRFADAEMDLVLSLLLERYELGLARPDLPPARRMGVSRPQTPCPVTYRPRRTARPSDPATSDPATTGP